MLRRTERWSEVSNASISFGQEVGVTPLQLLTAIATVANGGVRVAPHVVDHVVDAGGNVIAQPPRPAPARVISERTAAILNEILKAVVARGTGRAAALAEHVVAGKTGTAQKYFRGGYSVDKVVASFAGYAPADRPRLAILVVVDEPKLSQYGGTVAAPVFREIAESTLRYLGVAPTIPGRTLGVSAPLLAAFSQDQRAATDLRGLDARAAIARATSAGLRVRAMGSGVVQSQTFSDGVLTLQLGEVTP